MVRQIILGLGLILAFPKEAQACGGSPNFAIIHSALPKTMPEGAFVADIEIQTDDAAKLYTTGLRAHVRKMIAGGPVEDIILRLPSANSCDAPFANGRSGLFVGVAEERSGDELVVSPLLVTRYDGFKLPDGFKLAKVPSYGPHAPH